MAQAKKMTKKTKKKEVRKDLPPLDFSEETQSLDSHPRENEDQIEGLVENDTNAGQPVTPQKPKTPKKGAKKIRGKRYQALVKDLDKSHSYPLPEAIEVVKNTSKTKFDSSVEVHMNLNLDVSKADQTIRSTVVLPHASGKKIKILVFTSNPADLKGEGVEVGDKKTISDIASTGKITADKIISTPDMMSELSSIARILGPKGLMPNPKTGTVTTDVKKTISDLQGGMIEYRTENRPIVHATVGKASQETDKIVENFKTLFEALSSNRPKGAKGELVRSIYITSTMGPSVQVDLSSLR